MGRIEADIALESWLFGFRPCLGQGQLTLPEMCPMGIDVGLEALIMCEQNTTLGWPLIQRARVKVEDGDMLYS